MGYDCNCSLANCNDLWHLSSQLKGAFFCVSFIICRIISEYAGMKKLRYPSNPIMDRTSLTLVGGFILLIAGNFSSAGHIPWIPILCPKNSNSSLKKSDLDSLTFNLNSRNFLKICSRWCRCCWGESLKSIGHPYTPCKRNQS